MSECRRKIMCASHLLNRWFHGVSNTGEQEMVQVSLEQIQPFSLNPRVTRNPGYDVLKASILARGLDNPPVLTRRPGDEKYMLASGGIRASPSSMNCGMRRRMSVTTESAGRSDRGRKRCHRSKAKYSA